MTTASQGQSTGTVLRSAPGVHFSLRHIHNPYRNVRVLCIKSAATVHPDPVSPLMFRHSKTVETVILLLHTLNGGSPGLPDILSLAIKGHREKIVSFNGGSVFSESSVAKTYYCVNW